LDAGSVEGGVININADLITTGTLSGRNVQSSSGGNRIVLNNGNYLQFFRGGTIRAQLRGNSAVKGGIVQEVGNYILPPNNGFLAASNSGLTDFFKFYALSSGQIGIISAPAGNQILMVDSPNENQRIAFFTNSFGRIRTRRGSTYSWLPYVDSIEGSTNTKPIKIIRFRTLITIGAGGYGQSSGAISAGTVWNNALEVYAVATASSTGDPGTNEYNASFKNITTTNFRVELRHLNYTNTGEVIAVTGMLMGHIASLADV